MAKHTFILSVVFTGLAFTGCSYENENLGVNTLEEETMKHFILPDSINTNLIAAMYEEHDPARRSLLVYTDDNKTSARKITYFADQPPTAEPIVSIRYNEFSSQNTEYIIRKKTVLVYYKGPNSSNSISYNWASETTNSAVYEHVLMNK